MTADPGLGYIVQQCRSCGAPVVWAKHFTTGKSSPIDPEPVEGGNVALWPDDDTGEAIYSIPKKGTLGGPLRTSHFATCPQAEKWRK